MNCHPGYGHGKRVDRYRADDWGNGYLLVVTDGKDNYLSSLTGMPQTKAVAPFKAPIDEDKIKISYASSVGIAKYDTQTNGEINFLTEKHTV